MAKCAVRRQTLKVGAECPNWTRSELCGGGSNGRPYRERYNRHLRTIVLTAWMS